MREETSDEKTLSLHAAGGGGVHVENLLTTFHVYVCCEVFKCAFCVCECVPCLKLLSDVLQWK